MDKVNNSNKLAFLIDISRGSLSKDSSWDEACDFWYRKSKYKDIYDAAASIPYDRTFARTVWGISKNENGGKMVALGKKYVAERLRTINVKNASEFDDWHRECVEKLVDIFKTNGQILYVGQGQKWINMALKHLWIVKPDTVESFFDYCHIPLDNYLYDALMSDDTPDEFKGMVLPFNPYRFKSWSRIDDYRTYLDFQKEFRRRSTVPPLEAEFFLWLKGKKS